ncbi:MAG: glycerophosphodiester phosphodiesterase family protein [Bacteroidota bacterium]
MHLPSAMTVIAHRGSSGTAPENTMVAFRRAAAAGADMIELDVRLTADDVLVVFHDRQLRRTTNGRGAVRNRTVDELNRLDAGSWFSHRYAGEQIPALITVLAQLPGRVGLNIEVKTDGDRRSASKLASGLAEILRDAAKGRALLVSSFDHSFLRRYRTFDADTPIGVLAMPVRDAGVLPSYFARSLGASTYVCSRSSLRKRFVRDAHQHSMRVYVYGVNTSRHLLRPRRFGVDGVISNYPSLMLKLTGRSVHRISPESP